MKSLHKLGDIQKAFAENHYEDAVKIGKEMLKTIGKGSETLVVFFVFIIVTYH